MQPLTILPRRDTEENWEITNPVLKKGEMCIVYSQWNGTMYKLGDGETPYSFLPFVTLEDMLENGCLFTNSYKIKLKGFIKEKRNNEEIHCPREFIW